MTDYSAVQLFAQSARRVQPDFSLPANQDCVLTICRLVEGVPLAIELAAAWMKVMPCTEIAEEIDQGLDFLTTSLRDVPTRHRSLRAVFDHSWRLLSGREREVFRRLSVFRGGFRKQAAAQIAGASLLDLAAMVEKSLLKVTPTGRYRMHELLRQFAAEKLAEAPKEKEETKSRHSEYFIAFVNEREQLLSSDRQKTAINEIGQETKNIRQAYDRVVEQGSGEASKIASNNLSNFITRILTEDELQENEAN